MRWICEVCGDRPASWHVLAMYDETMCLACFAEENGDDEAQDLVEDAGDDGDEEEEWSGW